ncbi:MAG: threonine aldolase family protein [Spirochaetia bacterium]
MKIIDLRSDTITKPTKEMRNAMYQAEVGDDVYSEDPTVNKLQDIAAERIGKEAALFIPSGTMGNLLPLMLLCGRGNEFIAHEKAHILHYELASCTAVAGAMPQALPGKKGILSEEGVRRNIHASSTYYMTNTRMITIENTHNLAGGTCYKKSDLQGIRNAADDFGLTVHMDGARLFNAAAATGMSAADICSYTDTVTFCLSKGLGAPVGSVLCGPGEFISQARRTRKMLGSGMRQAGIIAAAGIYALENNVERLAEDHEHAKELARALSSTEWAEVDADSVETNIFYFSVKGIPAQEAAKSLGEAGILCHPLGQNSIRFVTSLEVSQEDIEDACEIIKAIELL